jgi:hypothetical protein
MSTLITRTTNAPLAKRSNARLSAAKGSLHSAVPSMPPTSRYPRKPDLRNPKTSSFLDELARSQKTPDAQKLLIFKVLSRQKQEDLTAFNQALKLGYVSTASFKQLLQAPQGLSLLHDFYAHAQFKPTSSNRFYLAYQAQKVPHAEKTVTPRTQSPADSGIDSELGSYPSTPERNASSLSSTNHSPTIHEFTQTPPAHLPSPRPAIPSTHLDDLRAKIQQAKQEQKTSIPVHSESFDQLLAYIIQIMHLEPSVSASQEAIFFHALFEYCKDHSRVFFEPCIQEGRPVYRIYQLFDSQGQSNPIEWKLFLAHFLQGTHCIAISASRSLYEHMNSVKPLKTDSALFHSHHDLWSNLFAPRFIRPSAIDIPNIAEGNVLLGPTRAYTPFKGKPNSFFQLESHQRKPTPTFIKDYISRIFNRGIHTDPHWETFQAHKETGWNISSLGASSFTEKHTQPLIMGPSEESCRSFIRQAQPKQFHSLLRGSRTTHNWSI